MLALAACTGPGAAGPRAAASRSEAIVFAELPQGYGRGYPEVSVGNSASPPASLKTGAEAPHFSLVLEDGRTLELADLRGTPVMINFWATWCPPCRAEMPEIVQRAAGNDDLIVIAVNVQEDIDAVRSFAEEFRHGPAGRYEMSMDGSAICTKSAECRQASSSTATATSTQRGRAF